MSKGGGSGKQDVTQTSEPWSGLQPYILAMLNNASSIYNSGGPKYYPDSQVVPFSPQSELGMEMLQNRVLQGSPYQDAAGQFALGALGSTNPALSYFQGLQNSRITPQAISPATMNAATVRNASALDPARVGAVSGMDAAQIAPNQQVQAGEGLSGLTRQTFNQTMQGNFLNNNPFLDQTFNRASDAVTRQWNQSVLPGVNSTFSLSGRTGSGAHQNAVNLASEQLGNTLSDLGNQVYGQNYQQERDRMMQSANALGGFDTTAQGYGLQASSANASNALNRNLNQANLTQDARRFNVGFDQNRALQDAGYLQDARRFNVGFDQNRALQDAGYAQAANQFNAGQLQATRQFNAATDMDAQQLNQNFGLNLGNALGNAYQQQFGNQLAASNLGMSLSEQDFMDINRMLGLGQMVEGKANEYLGDQVNRFNYQQGAPERNLNWLAGLISGNPAANAAQTQMSNYDQKGFSCGDFAQNAILADLATGGKGMATIAGLIAASDITLKTNITPKGTVNGFNWYAWTWNDKAHELGLSGEAEGVIAQEIEMTRPDLVVMQDGYKAVNYMGVLYGTA